MSITKWISNTIKYGFGEKGREKKQAAKAKKRQAKFESERWDLEAEDVHRRYRDYDEYVEHQASKLPRIYERVERKEEGRFVHFKERFRGSETFNGSKNVLCLGARLGAEVRALHELGHFAVGLDLNPGEKNLYVLPGDFHNVVFPDNSVDVIYTNALDHVFDLAAVVKEVHRLLKPDGVFVSDVVPGFEEGFTPGEYESHHWPTIDTLVEKIHAAGNFDKNSRRDLGEAGEELWIQLEFRKSTSAPSSEQAQAESAE